VGFSKHIKPSAKVSRVGFSQKSSALSSIDVVVLSVSRSMISLTSCFQCICCLKVQTPCLPSTTSPQYKNVAKSHFRTYRTRITYPTRVAIYRTNGHHSNSSINAIYYYYLLLFAYVLLIIPSFCCKVLFQVVCYVPYFRPMSSLDIISEASAAPC
jgi:hypothetical protein